MPVNFSALTAVEAAEMFGVSEKTIRNWWNDNALPFSGSGRGRTVKASEAIRWYVDYLRKLDGNAGKAARRPSIEPTPEASETLEAAMLRRTVAEADLKELQLARERGEVAAIADVEKILSASVTATQTQILAVPSRLSMQMLGIEDQASAVAILTSEMRQLLSNLASIDAIREASGGKPEADDE